MAVTRREFLKMVGLAGGVLAAGTLGSGEGRNKITSLLKRSKAYRMICPFCSLGCTINVYFKKNKPVYVSGNPDDPRTGGSICSKALTAIEYIEKFAGAKDVKYRKPFSGSWETIGWEDAVARIADRIKKTRDDSFLPFDGSITVNRTEGIALIAGSSLTNEEAYLAAKMSRILGIPFAADESFARGDLSDSTMTSQFGFPGSTNPYNDISYASSVLIIGANPARNASVMMKYIMNVRKNGGKVITVDPVKTETASSSDLYCRIKPGTDSVFLMGMINNAIINGRYDKEYISEYTDASFIISQDSAASKAQSSKTKNEYERDARGNPKKDDELRHTRTVFQVLKESLAKYTPNFVSDITGCSPALFLDAAESFTMTRDRTLGGAVIFGSGISIGQNEPIRLLSILQMLLGNIGISGGGIYYLKSGANGLGVSFQMSSPYLLPGGLPLPSGDTVSGDDDFFKYIKNRSVLSNDQMSVNVRQSLKSHITSLLKAWFGESAKAETRYNFDWLPKTGKPSISLLDHMKSGKVKGLLSFGIDRYKARLSSKGLSKVYSDLDWLVTTGNENGLADFWMSNPQKNKTEVFAIPSIPVMFKEGSFTGSDRTTLWNDGFVNTGGTSEFTFISKLFLRIKSVYNSGGILPEPVLYSNWDKKCTVESVFREMSGLLLPKGESIQSFESLKDDGSTSCGNIFYAGMNFKTNNASRYSEALSRKKYGLFRRWGYSIPSNTRILFNRSSIDRNGQAFSEERSPISLDSGDKHSDVVMGKGSPKEINPFVFNRDGIAYMYLENAGSGLPISDIDKKKVSLPADSSVIVSGLSCGEYLAGNELYGESTLSGICEIPADTAKSKKIINGDSVSVKNNNGSAVFTAVVTSRSVYTVVAKGKNSDVLLPDEKQSGVLTSCDISKVKSGGKGGNA